MDGNRTCEGSCEWGECLGFVYTETFNTGPNFDHRCGFSCGSDWCALETDTTSACDLISDGPGQLVPPGEYEVEFYFADVGTYDFYVYAGNSQVGQERNYTNNRSSRFPRVTIPFDIDSCKSIDVKVRAHRDARIRIYEITIRRLGD
jgi:hypothetical protein